MSYPARGRGERHGWGNGDPRRRQREDDNDRDNDYSKRQRYDDFSQEGDNGSSSSQGYQSHYREREEGNYETGSYGSNDRARAHPGGYDSQDRRRRHPRSSDSTDREDNGHRSSQSHDRGGNDHRSSHSNDRRGNDHRSSFSSDRGGNDHRSSHSNDRGGNDRRSSHSNDHGGNDRRGSFSSDRGGNDHRNSNSNDRGGYHNDGRNNGGHNGRNDRGNYERGGYSNVGSHRGRSYGEPRGGNSRGQARNFRGGPSSVGGSSNQQHENYEGASRHGIQPKAVRERLPEAEFKAKWAKRREENSKKLKEKEILSFDHVRTRPENVQYETDRTPTAIGTPMDLLANFYKVKLSTGAPAWTLFNYRVDFEPEPQKTHEKRSLLREHAKDLRGYTFDGSNFYSPYPEQDTVLFSTWNNQQVELTIRYVADVEPENIQYLQVYGIIVRNCLRELGLQELGRHFFEHQNATKLSHRGLEIWPGYSVALRNYDSGLLVNVDFRCKVLRTESCLSLMQSCQWDEARIKDELVGNVVITQYNRKTYKISDIDWTKNPNSTFPCGRGKEKQEKTFVDYYKETYNGLEIKNLTQPLLISKPTRKDRHRGIWSDIILIPELCNLTGLSDEQRRNFDLMKDIHRVTSLNPSDRATKLNSFMGRLTQNPDVRNALDQWGMSVDSKMVAVTGRHLPTVQLKGKTKKGPNGRPEVESFAVSPNADWTGKFRGEVQMYSDVKLRKWALIVGEESRHSVSRLLDALTFVSKGLGIEINNQPEIIYCRDTRTADSCVTGVNQAIGRVKDCQLLFVILSNNNSATYSAIKRRCNIELGVPSQCFLKKHFASPKPGTLKSVCTKVVIQMNAKLGGEPWICNIPSNREELQMIVGFDVHHGGKSSIGAMVATTNQTFSQFYSTVSVHANQTNLSENMCKDFTSCLLAFQGKNNNELPSRVIFYRDGVGEGDLEYVNKTEVDAILKSVDGLYSGANKTLKFNFIIVTKKGNARLMTCGREIGNPPPGTCVDSIITMPERFDFFLVSQQARGGQTVSPTTYNVLRVDSDFKAEDLQKLTHSFCHLYYNWTGTVSVPFVCQYAHKLSYLTGTTYRDDTFVNQNLAHRLYFL